MQLKRIYDNYHNDDMTLKELTRALYKIDARKEFLHGVFEKIAEVFQMLADDSEKISSKKKRGLQAARKLCKILIKCELLIQNSHY